MKKEKKHKKAEPAEQKKRKRALIAAQLAPPEELSAAFSKQDVERSAPELEVNAADEDFVDGSVILDVEHIHIPREMLHPDGERLRSRFNPVLLVVLAISLSLTAFVAYLISVQPD